MKCRMIKAYCTGGYADKVTLSGKTNDWIKEVKIKGGNASFIM